MKSTTNFDMAYQLYDGKKSILIYKILKKKQKKTDYLRGENKKL